MSWALCLQNGAERVIEYEALLRSLFSSARAIGLCLYDRNRMPAGVIDGALPTHPVVHSRAVFTTNPFYDATVRSPPNASRADVRAKLIHLGAVKSDVED
jgi:hypothetical protein